ncbi:MAG: ABC transporter [Erysipelotrichaceae bacterium]|nr:MAG: ABC transporter [Erysipelotrichaceae bacterium]
MKKASLLTYVISIVVALIFILPVIYIIFSAFKPSAELFSANPTFIPKNWTLENFTIALSKGNFSLYIFNTFLVAISSTIIAVIINTMAGYALSKFRFKGENVIMLLILSTIMLPLEVIMVPIFSVLRFLPASTAHRNGGSSGTSSYPTPNQPSPPSPSSHLCGAGMTTSGH